MLNLIGAIFSLASLLLLAGTAFKNEVNVQKRIDRILTPVQSGLRSLRADKGYDELFVENNPWNKLMMVLLIPSSIFFIVFFIRTVKDQIAHHASEYHDPFVLIGLVLLMWFVVLPVLLSAVMYAVLYPLAFALRWAREGGTKAKFIARLGVVSGVVGIACQTASASLW